MAQETTLCLHCDVSSEALAKEEASALRPSEALSEGGKQCQNCKQSFVIEPEDFEFYSSIDVPVPTHCPDCRYMRRLANRNEWSLYKRPCSLCKKNIISIYNLDYPGPVYCQPCFWSDAWDARDFGRDMDFSRSFFDQYKEFRFSVPRLAITNTESVNSEYTNQSQENKDCYLIVASNRNENCLYGNWYQQSKYCVDCYMVEKSELLYESLNCVNCYGSTYLQNCYDCHSSHFLKNCRGCDSCFGSVSLRGKRYVWLNKQLSKSDYETRLASFVWSRENIRHIKQELHELVLGYPHKYYEGRNNIHSTGDYIENNKAILNCFNCKHSEDMKYSQDAWEVKTSLDLTEVLRNERDYEIEGCAYSARNMIVSKSWHIFDTYYSELCFHSNDLFGCISMNKKQYCILNKQYSKEEYHELKTRVVTHMKEYGEWGQFWPVHTSPFAYNETVAAECFPISKDEILQKGWRFYERDNRNYQITLESKNLPVRMQETQDSIVTEVIGCSNHEKPGKTKYQNCATAFRIVPQELEFYRCLGLPIPDQCFPCRRQNRLVMRNPRKLWRRACQCDGIRSKNNKYTNAVVHFHASDPDPTEFETSYAPERPEVVYCEACYQTEVV